VPALQSIQLRWFDHWLKGISNGVGSDARVRVFVMGADKWRTASSWPVPHTHYRRYYLHSAGHANSVRGDGRLSRTRPRARARREAARDRFTYDPTRPVPSIGGRFQASVPGGPYDQGPVLRRPDVLVYTTPRLRHDTEVTGPITVTLWARSSARDTDWTAKLDDVYPRGPSTLIEYGIQRARYRVSETHPTLIRRGRIYRYTIHVWPTSNLFKAGHRIRLELSSSNFPMYDRNPNTGHRFAHDTQLRIARQTIYHDARHPSAITLPIVSTPIR
jgi:putative CocE/NonD family hydrolase